MVAGTKLVQHIVHEMKLHISYCAQFGITVPEIEATEEHQACTAYTRYVLDVGQSEGWLALQMALAPCILGYGAIGQQLHADPATVRDGNTFWPWIQNYVDDDYVGAVKTCSELIERNASSLSPSAMERLVEIFIHATKVRVSVFSTHQSLFVIRLILCSVSDWLLFPRQGYASTDKNMTDGNWLLADVPPSIMPVASGGFVWAAPADL